MKERRKRRRPNLGTPRWDRITPENYTYADQAGNVLLIFQNRRVFFYPHPWEGSREACSIDVTELLKILIRNYKWVTQHEEFKEESPNSSD